LFNKVKPLRHCNLLRSLLLACYSSSIKAFAHWKLTLGNDTIAN
jgi:hypothetical protein